MPTERYFVVKAEVPDGLSFPFTVVSDTLNNVEPDGIKWSVEGEYESLEEIGEALFDIDVDVARTSGRVSEKNCRGCCFAYHDAGPGSRAAPSRPTAE